MSTPSQLVQATHSASMSVAPNQQPNHIALSSPSQDAHPAEHPNGRPSQNHVSSYKSLKWKHSSLPPQPSNCIVLKNLDYSMNQVTLEEVVRRVTGDRMGFVNITFVEDKATKSFRGMAFVNFHTPEDATAALVELTKMVINGRKVIAEYRRIKPGERMLLDKRVKKIDHERQTFEKDIDISTDTNGTRVDKRAAFFAKRDTVKKADEQKRMDERVERDRERENLFRSLLLKYGDGEMEEGDSAKDLVFDSSLTSYERKMVHQICSELGLGHISRFDDEGNRVLYVTKDPQRTVEWDQEAKEARLETRKQMQESKRKNKENNEWKRAEAVPRGPLTREEKDGIHWFKPRSAIESEEGNGTSSSGIRAPSYKVYIPHHKPSGPDGTIGFTTRSKLNVSKDAVAEKDCSETNGHVSDNATEANGKEETLKLENDDHSLKEKRKSGKGLHTVLNPSVPAFSPSCTPF